MFAVGPSLRESNVLRTSVVCMRLIEYDPYGKIQLGKLILRRISSTTVLPRARGTPICIPFLHINWLFPTPIIISDLATIPCWFLSILWYSGRSTRPLLSVDFTATAFVVINSTDQGRRSVSTRSNSFRDVNVSLSLWMIFDTGRDLCQCFDAILLSAVQWSCLPKWCHSEPIPPIPRDRTVA